MSTRKRFSNISFGGCFIHKKPKVEFLGNKKCELGDVLVLLRKQTMDDIRYNAALIQMKKGEKSPTKLSKNDIQLYLYENWPLFTLSSTKKQYDIYPKAVTQGALYGIILEPYNQQQKQSHQIYISEPMSRMLFPNEMPVARFVFDAINWHTGRSISDLEHKGFDEWSRLIWDLLQHAINDSFTLNSVGFNKSPQFSGDFESFAKDALGIDIGANAEGGRGEDFDFDYDDGFAVLTIDIKEPEEGV